MGHLSIFLTLLAAVTVILQQCGVFEDIRERKAERRRQKMQVKVKQKSKEKIYDHQWPEDKE